MGKFSSNVLSAPLSGRVPWRPAVAASALAIFVAAALAPLARAGADAVTPVTAPQVTWAPVGTMPESDALAASQITPQPENRPWNTPANNYVPSNFELGEFYNTKGDDGLTPVQANPLYAYVTGHSDLQSPSTDDLIQWAAHKWGIPEDWIRALAAYESWWRQYALGDLSIIPSTWYSAYPSDAQAPGGRVFEEAGITQIKWLPDESVNPGTRRLRRLSTAFALDYMGATIRYYYDGDCHSCGAGYGPGQQWASIGAWHSPHPWNNPKAQAYEAALQSVLASRVWATPAFERPCIISLSVGACEHDALG